MIDFFKEAKDIFDELVYIRRTLHKNPEVDRNLNFTSGFVESYLRRNYIEYKRFDNCGIIAEVGKGENVVALRADMDALEIEDLKQVEYKSLKKGYMHACGHDAHTAIQIGAAIILKKYENKLNGRIRFIFQPAEETDGGAKDMINYGALEGVKAIYALHVDEKLNTGTIAIKKGMVAAASNPFKIIIEGKGAHGANPQDGVDSIYIAAKIIDNLQGIISREISATDSAVITIGRISGGTAPNAIARQVEIEGIIRTVGEELRSFILDRIKELVNTTAKMYRGYAYINIMESYPSFSNSDALYEKFVKNFKNNAYINLIELSKPEMGVEDFSYYTKVVPGLYYRLGCRNEEKGIINPAHGSYFDIDEECLWIGTAVQCVNAFDFLNNHN